MRKKKEEKRAHVVTPNINSNQKSVQHDLFAGVSSEGSGACFFSGCTTSVFSGATSSATSEGGDLSCSAPLFFLFFFLLLFGGIGRDGSLSSLLLLLSMSFFLYAELPLVPNVVFCGVAAYGLRKTLPWLVVELHLS